jgi:hypothetical protein
MVDFAVDALCLILHFAICLCGFAKGIIENALGVAEDRSARLLNVLEDLRVGNDESRC